jgi:branched-chain amino acid transport system ATP-binding protein
MLNVANLSVELGGFVAVHDANLEVRTGELVVLLGANGAGKSTIFRALSGIVRPGPHSRIEFMGRNTIGLPPRALVEAGMSHCPEGRRLFPALSVAVNLRLGAYRCGDRSETARRLDTVFGLFPVLKARASDPAGSLSGGQQQMVAIGRALMARPKLLLLDEPSLGLAPLVVRQVLAAIQEINGTGTMVLLAEQNAYAALEIAHRGYVLENGRIVLEGPAAELVAHAEVKRAYIGA